MGNITVSPACTKSRHEAAVMTNNTNPVVNTQPSGAARKYLALGDSYTIGQSVSEEERYPVQAVASIRKAGINIADAEIIATTGWTTQDLWSAVKNKPVTPAYDVVSLLIGVNNQYQGKSIDAYQTEFITLLQRAIEFANSQPDHVVVISIPDYSVTPFAASHDRDKIAHDIDAFNAVNKQVAADYGVQYLDVTEASRHAASDRSLIAGDSLHFSGKEYAEWTSRLVPLIVKTLR